MAGIFLLSLPYQCNVFRYAGFLMECNSLIIKCLCVDGRVILHVLDYQVEVDNLL